MYDHSSVVIVLLLSVALLLATEAGYRIGARFGTETADSVRAQINTLQASLLGVLALLLGFTFSLSLQRYDSRSEAVVDETNAIGTAHLRARLLPEAERDAASGLLADYVELRIRAGGLSLDQQAIRTQVLAETARVQEALWSVGVRAAAVDPGPVTTGLFLQSINAVIDSYGSRQATLDRHVPEIVLFLLFGTFLLTACIVGYASGLSGHRSSFATYILVLLIVFLVFIIIDLDRPRRGLIEVTQQSMVELRTVISRPPAPDS